jgi:hypothetical protein
MEQKSRPYLANSTLAASTVPEKGHTFRKYTPSATGIPFCEDPSQVTEHPPDIAGVNRLTQRPPTSYTAAPAIGTDEDTTYSGGIEILRTSTEKS